MTIKQYNDLIKEIRPAIIGLKQSEHWEILMTDALFQEIISVLDSIVRNDKIFYYFFGLPVTTIPVNDRILHWWLVFRDGGII